MKDITKKERFVPTKERAWVLLEDGHRITYKVMTKIWKHVVKEIEKHPVFKIDSTVYFVMRDKYPA